MKTITLSFLIISVLTLNSCKKCADCTRVDTTTASPSTPGFPYTSKTTFEACGDELKEVDGKTTTSKTIQSGVTVTLKSTTTCVDK